MTARYPLASGYFLQPSSVTEVDSAGGIGHVYRIEHAKMRLDIPFEDNEQDARLLVMRKEAQAIVESFTGLCIADAPGVELEFTNTRRPDVSILELSRSDFKSDGIRLFKVDSDDEETELASSRWELKRLRARLYLRLKRSNPEADRKFRYSRSGDVVARILATRGVVNDRQKNLIRVAMNHVMVELDKDLGTTAPNHFSDNPGFMRIIRQLQNSRPIAQLPVNRD